jgi:hypothetical protein
MILNAFAVLVAFLDLLRLPLSLFVIGMGLLIWHRGKVYVAPDQRRFLEDRCYLLFLLALLLLSLNLVSWPLFYWLLQSYVPQWPGVMCIYGVTQIGAGSLGPARFLPGLVKVLQVTKPLLIFVGGAWFVLYRVNRRSGSAPLLGPIVAAVIILGLLGLVDSLAEGAYVVIPKKEEFASAGCCTMVFDSDAGGSRFLPRALVGEQFYPWLTAAYFGLNLGITVTLALCRAGVKRPSAARWLVPLGLAALLSWPVNAAFLIEIAAPALLHLPYHHCPYDLVPEAPESLVAVALFVVGSFAVGWAWLLQRWARVPEMSAFVRDELGKVLLLGLVGYGASVGMMAVELAVA